ncbi:MAG: hypothetical protein Q8M19_17255 [Reyranella sp.]|nr:hypothetical protein [Reyranella sp.]
MSQARPAPEKLSDHIGDLARIFDGDVLLPEQIAALVDFHRRYLGHLQVFAADFEFAQSRSPGPMALSLAAAASMRFYRRLTAPAPPIVDGPIADVEIPSTATLIDLDAYRRPPAPPTGGAA